MDLQCQDQHHLAPRVLLVDDNVDWLNTAVMLFQIWEWPLPQTATSLQAALEKRDYDVVILDLGLPDCGGLSSLAQVKQHFAGPVIVHSAAADEDLATQAIRMGAADFIVKPLYDMDIMKRRILYALAREEKEGEPCSDS